jgi:DNA repair exonuclease SbcCD ATPase subunit
MVKKPSKTIKKISSQTTKTSNKSKIVRREPTPAAILKKVATISDSTKALQKEIKAMSKIFGDNQKVLVSMKGMIDILTSTLENIQKQSSRLNIIEDDTQKLYAGLNQVRTQSNIITKINDQTSKLQKEVNKINQLQKLAPKPEELSKQVAESMNSIQNNSQMIIKIAQRIDEVRDDLRNISGKTNSVLDISKEIDSLKNTIQSIAGKTDRIESSSNTISSLKKELDRIVARTESFSNLNSELNAIKTTIDSISGKAEKIDSLGGVIDGLKQQFDTVASKTNSLSSFSTELESIRNEISSLVGKTQTISEFGGKLDKIETEVGTLSQRADSTAFVGEGLKSVQGDMADFKNNIFDKTNTIEQKVSSINELLKTQDALSAEFHKKTDKVFQELQLVKNVTNKVSTDTSKEMMALLKLSEYQSNIRMLAESKYGEVKDLESMATQTADIVNLFDRLSIEASANIPLPHEVRRWAVSKIFDSADKWEIRFSDVFSILIDSIGRELVKESIRIQQIRDIYGIRAVDEIRNELNIS